MPDKNKMEMIKLLKLLKQVVLSPKVYLEDVDLIKALKNQKELSKYENQSCDKVKVSLNTLKNRANENIDGGFKVLDDYRVSALQAIQDQNEQSNKSNTRTRTGLSKRASELSDEVLVMKKICTNLIEGIFEAIEEIEALAPLERKDVRERRAKQAVRKLKSMFTLHQKLFDTPKITDNILGMNSRSRDK